MKSRNWKLVLLLGAVVSACATTPPPAVAPSDAAMRFEQGAFPRDGGFSRGIAWGDFDGDGDPDLAVANTNNQRNFVYRNERGSFTPVAEWDGAEVTGSTEGAAWVDIEGDGDLDLFFVNQGGQKSELYLNQSGRLVRDTTSVLTSLPGNGTTSCWGDVDRDGDLDAFIARRNGQDDVLALSDGRGGFTLAQNVLTTSGGDSRTCAFADFDLDDDLDLFVGNAHGASFLYRNDGTSWARLDDAPMAKHVGYTYGSSWVDFDNDGDFDLYKSHVNERTVLFRNLGNGAFEQTQIFPVAGEVGASKGQTWADFDNDGDLDLLQANGTPDPNQFNFLFRNRGDGTFERIQGLGLTDEDHVSTSVATADIDGDGDLDVFNSRWRDEKEDDALFINQTAGGRWLRIRLRGAGHNTWGVGARVIARATIRGKPVMQTRQLAIGAGYGGHDEPIIHFGLGDARSVSIEVRWPRGGTSKLTTRELNRVIEIREG